MKLTIVNEHDGSVSAHKAGCKDLVKARVQGLDRYTEEYASQRAAYLDYNQDFIAEAGGDEAAGWPIDFKNCCSGLVKA